MVLIRALGEGTMQNDSERIRHKSVFEPKCRLPVLFLLLGLLQSLSLNAAEGPGAQVVLVEAKAGQPSSGLHLTATPISVFSSDATLVLKAEDGSERSLPRPRSRLFALRGADGSRGILRQLDHGAVAGWLQTADGFSRLDGKAVSSVQSKTVNAEGIGPAFRCSQEDLAPPNEALLRRTSENVASTFAAQSKAGASSYRARLAIETDEEFLAKFSGTDEATAYVQSLIGFISVIYEDEIDTELQVGYLRLWESPDPYEQSSANCLLYEAGRYWNQNETAIERTTMHYLSGKPTGGGVAWIGVLCQQPFNYNVSGSCPGLTPGTDQYGGAYGYTGGIDGNFDGSNGIIWDVIGTAHEIGHNFNSPHTHCYAGIGGSTEPIDQCYGAQSGCYSGPTSLPGPQGQGSGTLMSYCHLLSGVYSNISLNFGLNHGFGVAPEREAVRMAAHVADRAASNPSCLIPPPPEVFDDGFE